MSDETELHVCATCDDLVGNDHPAEWMLPDGTWTHNEPKAERQGNEHIRASREGK